MAAKFEIYKDTAKQYRFRLKAANGEKIAASEAYTTKQSARDGIEAVKTAAAKAEIVDLT